MEINDKVLISKDKLDSLANAINAKNNTSGAITLDEMIARIGNYQNAFKIFFDKVPIFDGFFGRTYTNEQLKIMLPTFDTTSNLAYFYNFFAYNQSATALPLVDTSKGTTFQGLCRNCPKLEYIPAYNLSGGNTFDGAFSYCGSLKSILCYGMKASFNISWSTLLEEQALVTIGSNCQVVTTTRTLTLGNTLKAKVASIYVKKTGVELYEGITCDPCVICESTDEGAMLFTEYMNGKGWTLA